MILASQFNMEIFFVLWLIGLLIMTEMIDSRFLQTRYLKKIKYIIAISVGVFGFIVVEKILAILSK